MKVAKMYMKIKLVVFEKEYGSGQWPVLAQKLIGVFVALHLLYGFFLILQTEKDQET